MENHSVVFFSLSTLKFNKGHCCCMEVQGKWVFINWSKMQEIQWAYVNNFRREGSFSKKKKGQRYLWPIWAKQVKEKQFQGGIFPHCIAWHSTSNFVTALFFLKLYKALEKGFNLMTEYQRLTINHCVPLYGGHTKQQSTYGCTLAILLVNNNHRLEDIQA